MKNFIKILLLCALFIFSTNSWSQQASDPNQINAVLKNTDSYIHQLNFQTSYKNALNKLGKPRQSKAGPRDTLNLMWDFNGYSLDATFDKEQKLISLGIHWFGLPSDIPHFKDLLAGEYKVVEKRGTQIVKINDGTRTLYWTIKPIQNMDKKISVLSIYNN